MKPHRNLDWLVYALVVLVSVMALLLMASVPGNFLNARVVYQGF